VTEVAKIMRLEKSTVSRLLATMATEGFVLKDPHTGKYELAPRTYQVGLAYLSGLALRRVAMPYLEELAFAVSETVYLGILGDGAAVYIDKILSPLSLRVDSYIGCAIPLHATALGKALLAGQPEEYVDALARGGLRAYTRRTITSLKALRAELQQVRQQGFALDLEEFEENLHCVGLPIRDYRGTVVAAFSVSGPAIRFTRQVIATHLPRLKRTAAAISSRLGFETDVDGSWASTGAMGRAGTRSFSDTDLTTR
jgi:IclR family acetate operon transcriptional repressor